MAAIQRRGSTNQNHRDSMSQFLCPDNGYRGKQQRHGIQPKDHMKENRVGLKQTQLQNRMKREEESRPAKELYKLSQFKNVESKLYDERVTNTTRRPSMDGKEFLTRGISEKRREEQAMENRLQRIALEEKMREAKELAAEREPLSPRKPSVPRAYETAKLAPPSNSDFISRNKAKAIAAVPNKREKQDMTAKHEEYGRVPEYLEERKAKWAMEEEERRRNMPDPSCPPGMCVMPEEERVNTLETLKRSKEEALAQLRKMPFVIETPSLRRKQEFLENKLREIDNALVIFSKPKVFVAMD